MQEQTWGKISLHKLVFLCGCVVLCGVGGVGGEVSEETIQTYLYSNCAFNQPHLTKSSNKFYRTNPTSGKSLGQHNPLHLFLSACCKPEQNPCKNKHGENCIAQVVVGILCGCVVLLVVLVVLVVK